MFPLLYDLFFTDQWPFVLLRLFRYPLFRTLGAGIFAFLGCCLLTPFFTRFLSRKKLYEETRHFSLLAIASKRHVPTMGGVVIVLTIVINMLLWCRLTDPQVWLLAAVALFLGGGGLLDDTLKTKRGNGISRRAKYIICIVFACGVLAFVFSPITSPFEPAGFRWSLFLPFMKQGFAIGILLLPLELLFLVFTANAVNISDGMDGLASVPVILTSLVMAVMAYILGTPEHVRFLLYFPFDQSGVTEHIPLESLNILITCACIAGSVAGFLWHNAYPAIIIMGDTGSLALGGLLGTIAILLKQEALFFIAGGVFVIETASAFLQNIIGIKLFGRRLFYRAPYHDQLLFKGTGETKVTIRLWLLSAFFALIALTTLKLR